MTRCSKSTSKCSSSSRSKCSESKKPKWNLNSNSILLDVASTAQVKVIRVRDNQQNQVKPATQQIATQAQTLVLLQSLVVLQISLSWLAVVD